jgi:hypothetical protein
VFPFGNVKACVAWGLRPGFILPPASQVPGQLSFCVFCAFLWLIKACVALPVGPL